MVTINVAEAHEHIAELWHKAAQEPITVLSDGQAIAVVLSPSEFERLTARRRGAKAGFAKHLFPGIDMNALLATNIDDVFEEYR